MPQVIGCPKCKTQMRVPDGMAGRSVKCPTCQTVFPIPASAPVPEPAGVGAPAATPSGSSPAPAPAPERPPSKPNMNVPAPSRVPPEAPQQSTTPSNCPACGADLLPGAVACMDCGFLVQSDTAAEIEGAPNLCPNPACGVANPPGERNCQRCSTPLPTSPGTVLHGRYRIEKLIAMGGFGAVYLATDTKNNNRSVAIKDMICADPQEFAIRLNFFRREAEILRSLENLNIVPRVFELIEQGQSAHLVLEFIRGQDLLKLMEDHHQQFTLDQAIEWGKAICDVLQHMHSQQPPLVHRDLKPDNIMLLEDKRAIKMIDFGTARDLGRTQKEKMAAKTRVYTEGYAPPEQIVGKPEARSDLFALAGTLYHVVTGEAPEGYYTVEKIKTDLESGKYPPEHHWFYELIRINLAEDVNERYFSAKEIKNDLERRQVSTTIACGKCRHANKVREPYCVKCAEPLTDPTAPCHHCGKSNRMGSRHCIYCGNRLR